MGWFSERIKGVLAQNTVDWMFIENLPDPGLGISGNSIVEDQCYVEIYVESFRLKQARRLATQFHAAVYSFFRLSQEDKEDVEIASVSEPTKLATLDSANLDRVITASLQTMGPLPWRGGTLSIELGLFSVRKGNLLSPVLEYVTRVSEQAGISFLGQIKPFVGLVTSGMDLIAGQTQDAVIEVALDTDIKLTQSRLCAIIALPKLKLQGELTLDPTDRKLLLDGKPFEEGYCVFSIRRTLEKANYGAIPEISAAFAALNTALRANDEVQAKTALALFRRTVLLSSDLIPSDKTRLIKKATERHDMVLGIGVGPIGVSRKGLSLDLDSSSLGDLDLYDRRAAGISQTGPGR